MNILCTVLYMNVLRTRFNRFFFLFLNKSFNTFFLGKPAENKRDRKIHHENVIPMIIIRLLEHAFSTRIPVNRVRLNYNKNSPEKLNGNTT